MTDQTEGQAVACPGHDHASACPWTRRAAWLLAVLAVAIVFAYANRGLLRGTHAPAWDADSFFAPFHMLLADHARAGRLLLWDPWTHGGFPVCAYTEIGTFSPVTLASALVTGSKLRGFVCYWLGFWLAGGFGMFLLARHLGAAAWGALVVTLGFLFCGFFMGHAEHISWVYTFAFLPWIVWRLDVGLLERRCRPVVEAGALWGLSAMAGYPGVVLTHAMVAFLWTLGRALCPPDSDATVAADPAARPSSLLARLSRGLVGLVVFVVVGTVVLSPTFGTFAVEARGYTDRAGGLPRAVVTNDNPFDPRGIYSLVTPHVNVWQMLNPKWSYTDPSSVSIYLGIGVTWLALLGLVLRPRSAWRWWLLGIALLGLGLAMGRALPLRGWLYDLLPPARYFRHSALFSNMTVFALTALAACGAADLARSWRNAVPQRPWRVLLTGLLLAAAGVIAYRFLLAGIEHHGPWIALVDRLVYFGWPSLAVLGVVGCAACWWRPLRVVFVLGICTLACADALETANMMRLMLFSEAQTELVDWNRRLAQRRSGLDLLQLGGLERQPGVTASQPATCNNKHLLARTAVFRGYVSLGNGFYEAWVSTPALAKAALGPQRIWFSADAVPAPLHPGTFHAFFTRSKEVDAPVMVVHPPESMVSRPPPTSPLEPSLVQSIMKLPAAERINVEMLDYQPTALAFRVNCPRAGWIMVTDRWASGWKATVNQSPATVCGGGFIFRAVQVAAGENTIRFTYRPWGHPWLLIASWGTLGAVAVAAAGAAWANRRNAGGCRAS